MLSWRRSLAASCWGRGDWASSDLLSVPASCRAPDALFARRRVGEAISQVPHLTHGLSLETRRG